MHACRNQESVRVSRHTAARITGVNYMVLGLQEGFTRAQLRSAIRSVEVCTRMPSPYNLVSLVFEQEDCAK